MGTFILCSRFPPDRYTSCVCSYMCCFCVNVLPLTSVWCQPHPHIHSLVNVVTSVSLCHQQNGHQVGWRMCLEQVYILCCKLPDVIERAIALIPSCLTVWYLVPMKFIEVLRTFIRIKLVHMPCLEFRFSLSFITYWEQDCMSCPSWRSKKTLPRRSVLWTWRTFSRYARECNVMCYHKKILAIPSHISIELKGCQQNSVRISYTEFHPRRTLSVEGTDKSMYVRE